MEMFNGYPFGLALAFLFCIAMLRGQATYWIARYVTEQTLKRTRPAEGWQARVHGWLSSNAVDRGRDAVQRCGIFAVPLAYLTVGIQTVVLASAGVIRMRWLRFTLAQSLGALAWGLIYSTIGFAMWAAFFEAAVADRRVLVVLATVLVALIVAVSHRVASHRRLRREAAACPVGAHPERETIDPDLSLPQTAAPSAPADRS
ncbi:DedA family protein [Ornithinimicrobium panacihumi]|uniref:DedA family protein n=1 Tax=Ornithinimicrobium panacihumi TaxID=2008449 RepID=UPI003F8C33CB